MIKSVYRLFIWQSHQKLQFIRYRLSIGLSTSVRLQGGPTDLQSLTMWYAVWGSPHRLSSLNPLFTIESPNFPIPVRNLFSWTRFAIYLVGPRLFVGGLVLGVCLTSLGCVVAVSVVLVLADSHSLVVIPEMDEEVCKI